MPLQGTKKARKAGSSRKPGRDVREAMQGRAQPLTRPCARPLHLPIRADMPAAKRRTRPAQAGLCPRQSLGQCNQIVQILIQVYRHNYIYFYDVFYDKC